MNAKDIKFGRQIQYNAESTISISAQLEGQLVTIQVIGEIIYVKYGGLIELKLSSEARNNFLEDLNYFGKKLLIRIDSIIGRTVTFSTLIFGDRLEIVEPAKLTLVLNRAIQLDLEKLNIRTSDLNRFFEDEFTFGHIAFALKGSNTETFTLISNKYECIFEKTAQNILQATSFSKRSRQNQVNSVAVLEGQINFQDHLTNAQVPIEMERNLQKHLVDNFELLKLWELYSELELEAARNEVELVGSLAYDSVNNLIDQQERMCATFKVSEKPSSDFLSTNMGFAVATDTNFNDENLLVNKADFIGSTILKHKKVERHFEISIVLAREGLIVPPKGYIMASFQGSEIMAKRRKQALHKILEGQNALPTLKYLLENGDSEFILQHQHKAKSADVLKKVFKTKKMKFTGIQERAIEMAINTSDLAIIQGPPGTGKTTIIRAIIARINEIHEGKATILISSAQHDAVDNAIEDVEYGGLPAYRIGGKGDNQKQSPRAMLKWIDNVEQTTNDLMLMQEGHYERKQIRYLLMQLQQILHEEEQKAIKQLKLIVPIFESLTIDASPIANLQEQSAVTLSTNDEEPPQHAIVPLLKAQRTTVDTFMDDGVIQLSSLIRFWRTNEMENDMPSLWAEMRLADDEELPALLLAFEESIETLLTQFEQPVVVHNVANITVKDIIADLQQNIQQYLNKKPLTLTDVLVELQDSLENPRKVSELISKYTNVNAATCQQAVKEYSDGIRVKQDSYHYVIIDESARANPLDLLIPMSLGRKIILVGDQMQLPHILEKEVVEALITQKKGDAEIAELLAEPLFTRLFNMLKDTKTRTVMLEDQYRMHPTIAKFVSDAFYNGKLKSGVTKEQRSNTIARYEQKAVAWIDVPYEKGREQGTKGTSKYRMAEVDALKVELYKVLAEEHVYDIGIITFYKEQMNVIQAMVEEFSEADKARIEVGTVDAFQGKEFDIVFLSTVRSNKARGIRERVGFLHNDNRLNVAFSRAKRLLVVLGDSETVCGASKPIIPSLHQLKQLCIEEGYYE